MENINIVVPTWFCVAMLGTMSLQMISEGLRWYNNHLKYKLANARIDAVDHLIDDFLLECHECIASYAEKYGMIENSPELLKKLTYHLNKERPN